MKRPTAKQKQWHKACKMLSTQLALSRMTHKPSRHKKRSLSAVWLCVVVCSEHGMWAAWVPTRKPVGGLSNASNTQLIWQISHSLAEEQFQNSSSYFAQAVFLMIFKLLFSCKGMIWVRNLLHHPVFLCPLLLLRTSTSLSRASFAHSSLRRDRLPSPHQETTRYGGDAPFPM